MSKTAVTTNYRKLLFDEIIKFRNMMNKSSEQRMHLMNMEAEYRDLVNKIAEKKIKESRLTKSERLKIGWEYIADYWTPKATYVCAQ